MSAMDDNSKPSKPEGSGTFQMATWNIVDGRGGRMTQAAAGLAQLKDESQKRETSEMNLKKQENCELRFIYLSEQS